MMPGFQIIEIILALLALYIFLSILMTAFNEFLDIISRRRSKLFRNAIDNLIGDESFGVKFWGHPLIKSIANCTNTKSPEYPPEIPDSIIADVFLDIWMNNIGKTGFKDTDFNKRILIQINNAQGKMYEVKKQLIKWLAEFWKPITKKYKADTVIITFLFTFFLAIPLNIDTIMFVRIMWANRALTQIHDISAKAVTPDSLLMKNKCEAQQDHYWNQVESTSRQYQFRFFPLGWVIDDETNCKFKNLRGLPLTYCNLMCKYLGLFITALMVSLGADFWFKILERYIKVKV